MLLCFLLSACTRYCAVCVCCFAAVVCLCGVLGCHYLAVLQECSQGCVRFVLTAGWGWVTRDWLCQQRPRSLAFPARLVPMGPDCLDFVSPAGGAAQWAWGTLGRRETRVPAQLLVCCSVQNLGIWLMWHGMSTWWSWCSFAVPWLYSISKHTRTAVHSACSAVSTCHAWIFVTVHLMEKFYYTWTWLNGHPPLTCSCPGPAWPGFHLHHVCYTMFLLIHPSGIWPCIFLNLHN